MESLLTGIDKFPKLYTVISFSMTIVIGIFTFILVLIAILLILLVLMQKSKTDGSMAAALGGGATEAAFGADTGNVLSRLTIKFSIAFFILTFLLYLANIHLAEQKVQEDIPAGALPDIDMPAPTAPAATPEKTETAKPAAQASSAAPAETK